MIYPTESEFQRLAEKGNVIPVYREILADGETPASAYHKLAQKGASFLLESVEGGERWARYSFLGIEPKAILRYSKGRLEILRADGQKRQEKIADPFQALKGFLKSYQPVSIPDLPPFWGGLIGFLSYDSVRYIEKIGDKTPGEDFVFLMTDTVVVFDNLRHTVKIIANATLPPNVDSQQCKKGYLAAVRRIEKILDRLKKPSLLSPFSQIDLSEADGLKWKTVTDREGFKQQVLRVKEYIRAGDVIQTVLSRRMELPYKKNSFNLYRALRLINPSPYMFYLNLGSKVLIGSSPEILVRLEGKEAVVRPIAGTRPRGRGVSEDLAMEEELKKDEKERAEHLMLVDLGRNDLGRVCNTGSIRLTDFMIVERYSHVMHLVSNVVGKLSSGKDSVDLLRATFPAGTVSGAPKVRAMQIIEELEPVARGPYAGAIGYFSFSGDMDLCIAIRTMWLEKRKLFLQSGAGIVADSDPERELEETENKARALLRAVMLANANS
ncbi:MAG: anthranilate synthase component I [Deltaproteobacteria bacterium]|nr:anthranilate synthase component I [Deltaproteobacteria bacterium]